MFISLLQNFYERYIKLKKEKQRGNKAEGMINKANQIFIELNRAEGESPIPLQSPALKIDTLYMYMHQTKTLAGWGISLLNPVLETLYLTIPSLKQENTIISDDFFNKKDTTIKTTVSLPEMKQMHIMIMHTPCNGSKLKS